MSEQQESSSFKPVAPVPGNTENQNSKGSVEAHASTPTPAHMTGVGTNPDGSIAKQSSVLAVIALIIGIICILIPLLALPALIISIIGMKQTAGNKQSGRGMAIAGLVMSIIGMIEIVLLISLFAVGLVVSRNAANTLSSSNISSTSLNNASSETKTITGVLKTAVAADRYTLTVNSVERGYKPSSDYYTPKAGSEFILVSVTLKNNDTYAHSFSSYDFKVRDSSGVEHADKFMTGIVNELSYKSVESGNETTGNIVFEVPSGDTKQVLVYDPGYFSNQQAEVSL